jgi:hypothetical protein
MELFPSAELRVLLRPWLGAFLGGRALADGVWFSVSRLRGMIESVECRVSGEVEHAEE